LHQRTHTNHLLFIESFSNGFEPITLSELQTRKCFPYLLAWPVYTCIGTLSCSKYYLLYNKDSLGLG